MRLIVAEKRKTYRIPDSRITVESVVRRGGRSKCMIIRPKHGDAPNKLVLFPRELEAINAIAKSDWK